MTAPMFACSSQFVKLCEAAPTREPHHKINLAQFDQLYQVYDPYNKQESDLKFCVKVLYEIGGTEELIEIRIGFGSAATYHQIREQVTELTKRAHDLRWKQREPASCALGRASAEKSADKICEGFDSGDHTSSLCPCCLSIPAEKSSAFRQGLS